MSGRACLCLSSSLPRSLPTRCLPPSRPTRRRPPSSHIPPHVPHPSPLLFPPSPLGAKWRGGTKGVARAADAGGTAGCGRPGGVTKVGAQAGARVVDAGGGGGGRGGWRTTGVMCHARDVPIPAWPKDGPACQHAVLSLTTSCPCWHTWYGELTMPCVRDPPWPEASRAYAVPAWHDPTSSSSCNSKVHEFFPREMQTWYPNHHQKAYKSRHLPLPQPRVCVKVQAANKEQFWSAACHLVIKR